MCPEGSTLTSNSEPRGPTGHCTPSLGKSDATMHLGRVMQTFFLSFFLIFYFIYLREIESEREGYLGGSVVAHLPLAQVVTLGSWDQVLHGACFSLCLCLCLSVSLMNK